VTESRKSNADLDFTSSNQQTAWACKLI
jgi:hypothetical protein